MVGRSLNPGDAFAEVVDTSWANVDVSVDESDVSLLKPGNQTSVKLEAFPTHTFRGEVAIISPKSQVEGAEHFFCARVRVPNNDGLIRAGMQGRSKVSTGWSPAGWVIFRRPAMWLWSKIWSWIGW